MPARCSVRLCGSRSWATQHILAKRQTLANALGQDRVCDEYYKNAWGPHAPAAAFATSASRRSAAHVQVTARRTKWLSNSTLLTEVRGGVTPCLSGNELIAVSAGKSQKRRQIFTGRSSLVLCSLVELSRAPVVLSRHMLQSHNVYSGASLHTALVTMS